MINKDEDLGFITEEDGKETPIHVIQEFDNEENGKRFVIYTDIEDKVALEDKEFYVAEIVTKEDGSLELQEIEDEKDMEYCQDVFDDLIESMLADAASDEELDDEEDGEDDTTSTIVN